MAEAVKELQAAVLIVAGDARNYYEHMLKLGERLSELEDEIQRLKPKE